MLDLEPKNHVSVTPVAVNHTQRVHHVVIYLLSKPRDKMLIE